MRRLTALLVLFGAVWLGCTAEGEEASPPIVWHEWSPEIFAQARRENKFVLLDLEAVWCHWCHVMEDVTYRDPIVRRLMAARYLAVRVDQDARPDLANRYEDYGWPATIIYGPDGAELVKRQGYVPPRPMSSLLQAVIDDPTPGPSVRPEPATTVGAMTELGAERRGTLLRVWAQGYDNTAGGWGTVHKFLDADSVELAMRLARRGDGVAEERARATLRLQRRLIDPVWGGVYQYSVGGDWNEPHFEKIMAMQADNLRAYAQAYARWHEPADLEAAKAIRRFLHDFLMGPEGEFYTSQDADLVPGEHSAEYFAFDDTARRAKGIPRVDRHCYARENGWAIAALCELAAGTDDASARVEAERAASWIIAHRSLAGGGFRHDERDAAGPYLGDTLAMGRAFLALHQLTQDRAWLARAVAAADFIAAHFARPDEPGFFSSDVKVAAFPAPRPQFDENVAVTRFTTALAEVTGETRFREMAGSALRWLLAPGQTRDRGYFVAGLLLAEEDARTDPLHVMIVGRRDDPSAAAMLAAALRFPENHKLVEWWDRREGPAPRGEDIYPASEKAAAFLCANGACSAPFETAAALSARLQRIK